MFDILREMRELLEISKIGVDSDLLEEDSVVIGRDERKKKTRKKKEMKGLE